MKKLIPLFLMLVISTALAVDMKGKIGMGVGWTVNSEIFAPNAVITKYGLGENLVLEPSLTFSYNKNGEGSYLFDLKLLFAYALMAHEKTNLYAKAGISFGMQKTPKMTSFGIPLGLGLEHFLSDHFAVDVNHVMGFAYTKYDESKLMNFTITTSNLTAGLVWYY
uniref:Outer membrane protein beta-barrel domain-containing protein n=1 Tax=candidate division WOR-3 bacterium TaxID=2052148 RepID=A0A7C6AA19_UNCW3